uniref:Uncharacterized protein n=1 Tax=Romanomermis culicivorax TaxID=13658 RepID=A0A915KTQ8_ROMCU
MGQKVSGGIASSSANFLSGGGAVSNNSGGNHRRNSSTFGGSSPAPGSNHRFGLSSRPSTSSAAAATIADPNNALLRLALDRMPPGYDFSAQDIIRPYRMDIIFSSPAPSREVQ